MIRTPSSDRLRTSALLSRRMLDRDFRESLPLNEAGERHVVIADPEDRLDDVFSRISAVGLPGTICVPVGGGGLFAIVVRPPSEYTEDKQDCAPDIELGMLVELLSRTRDPLTVRLKQPVQIAFAYA